jgi:hypothetical protein
MLFTLMPITWTTTHPLSKGLREGRKAGEEGREGKQGKKEWEEWGEGGIIMGLGATIEKESVAPRGGYGGRP